MDLFSLFWSFCFPEGNRYFRILKIYPMTKRMAFFLFLFLSVPSLWSQTGYYVTYDDYQNNRLTEMEELWMMSSTGRMTFKKGGEKYKVEISQIWGCILGGLLFRRIGTGNELAAVIYSCPDAIIYGTGYYYATGFMQGTDNPASMTSTTYYISLNVTSPIVSIFTIGYPCTSFFKKFREENPQFKAFYDCIPGEGERFYEGSFINCVPKLRLTPDAETDED